MNKIDEMIRELCPEGVKRVKLGEVCEFNRGVTITKDSAIEGDVPVIAGGKTPAYYHNVANRFGVTIAVAGSGAYAGYVSIWKVPIFLSDAFSVDPKEELLHEYLYLCLQSKQERIFALQKGAGVPHVHGKDLAKFEIPLPPLAIQQEIVSILDSSSSLQSKLEEELAVRQKQMEFYREKLLTFDKDDNSVKWMKLGDVFDTKNGYTPSTSNSSFWDGGDIPWFKMEDIRDKGNILIDSCLHITPSAVKGSGLFKANSIIVATSATIGEHALVLVPHLCNQRFTNLFPKAELESEIDIKYMFYYMYIVDEWCKNHINQGGFASVDMGGFYKMPIPIPPLSRQQEIVSTLDTMSSLIDKLKEEIDLRKKQYEYYREALLSF